MQMPQTENRQIPKDRIEDRKIMKRIFLLFLMSLVLLIVTLTGCGRLENMDSFATTGATIAQNFGVPMPEGTIGSSLYEQLI